MATEILVVPEEHLADVIWVIRAGLEEAQYKRADRGITPGVIEQLTKWCDDQEEYYTEEPK